MLPRARECTKPRMEHLGRSVEEAGHGSLEQAESSGDREDGAGAGSDYRASPGQEMT
jgi:hypothetical protein